MCVCVRVCVCVCVCVCVIICLIKHWNISSILIVHRCSCVCVSVHVYVFIKTFTDERSYICLLWWSIIWKSDLADKMKRSFFQAAVTSILLYGCTTWTLTKRLEKKLDGNYTRMLRAILNKSWQQHPTRHQLYDHLPPITKTIQVRRTRHAGHCWRSRDELIRNVLLWIPTHGRAKAERPARTYIQQLCEDTGCCPEDLPRAMNDREEWRERVRDIRATSTIWWWWWWWWWWLWCNSYTVYFNARLQRHTHIHICISISSSTSIYLIAVRLDTIPSVKLGGFRSQLEASCVSSHTDKLLYNETVSL